MTPPPKRKSESVLRWASVAFERFNKYRSDDLDTLELEIERLQARVLKLEQQLWRADHANRQH